MRSSPSQISTRNVIFPILWAIKLQKTLQSKSFEVPSRVCKFRTAKSTHHPHKIDDQDRECKTGGGAYFPFFLGSDNSHTTPPKIPPDKEGLLWGWCVVGGPLKFNIHLDQTALILSLAAITQPRLASFGLGPCCLKKDVHNALPMIQILPCIRLNCHCRYRRRPSNLALL